MLRDVPAEASRVSRDVIEEMLNTLTFEQVREQLSLYNKLFYEMRKRNEPDYMEKRRQREKNRYYTKTGKSAENKQQPMYINAEVPLKPK